MSGYFKIGAIMLWIIASYLMVYRVGFVGGVNSERFDRMSANSRLQHCLEIVRNK